MTRSEVFIALIVVLVTALLSIVANYLPRARRVRSNDWEELLGRLSRLNRHNIALVALDVIDEDGELRNDGSPELDSACIWDLIGGMEGLETLASNCKILIDLASYVQLRYPEALLIAEELRLNARQIDWHIQRLKGAAETGHLASSFSIYGQRAVATYYLMTQRVLRLYESIDSPQLFELKSTL